MPLRAIGLSLSPRRAIDQEAPFRRSRSALVASPDESAARQRDGFVPEAHGTSLRTPAGRWARGPVSTLASRFCTGCANRPTPACSTDWDGRAGRTTANMAGRLLT